MTSIRWLALVGVVLVLPLKVVGQSGVPRLPWGDPNLQGIRFYQTQTPLQRPEAFADSAVLTPEEAAAFVAERHAIIENSRTRGDWLVLTGLTSRRTSRIVDRRTDDFPLGRPPVSIEQTPMATYG